MICFRISKSLDFDEATDDTPDSQTIEEYPNLNRPEPVHSSHDGRLQMSTFPMKILRVKRVICEGYPDSRHGANVPFVDMIGTMFVRPSYGHSLVRVKMDGDRGNLNIRLS